MKKIILGFTLPIILLPIISCSSSWTKWNESNNGDEQNIHNFANDRKKILESDWKINHDNVKKAINFEKKWIDITKLKNTFEFSIALVQFLKIENKSNKDLDAYYLQKDWKDFKENIFDNYEEKISFKIKFENDEILISWDIKKILDELKKSLFINAIPLVSTEKRIFDLEDDKQAIEKNNGIPANFNEPGFVSKKEVKVFLANKTIKKLLEVDPNFALRLSKFVNLERNAFLAINDLINEISFLYNKIFKSKLIENWVRNNFINLNVFKKDKLINKNEKNHENQINYLKANAIIFFAKKISSFDN